MNTYKIKSIRKICSIFVVKIENDNKYSIPVKDYFGLHSSQIELHPEMFELEVNGDLVELKLK